MEQAKELLADVARHRSDLIGLQSDPDVTPERMKRCMKAVDDLESAVVEILTTAWAPHEIPQLTTTIDSVRMNIRCVHGQVDRCIDKVISRGRMDEYLRLSVAMSMGRLLEFQLSVLCDALVNCMKCPSGCGAFVPSGWIN